MVISQRRRSEEPIYFVCQDLQASVGVLNTHTNRSWALSPKRLPGGYGSVMAMNAAEIVDHAGRLLADAVPPESKVILFGSHGRGDAGVDSDFDFLVIEPSVVSKAAEMVRLLAVLDPLRVAADVVVMPQEQAEAWGKVPGTLIHDALAEGRVLAET